MDDYNVAKTTVNVSSPSHPGNHSRPRVAGAASPTRGNGAVPNRDRHKTMNTALVSMSSPLSPKAIYCLVRMIKIGHECVNCDVCIAQVKLRNRPHHS